MPDLYDVLTDRATTWRRSGRVRGTFHIAIDSASDGTTFDVELIDISERRSDLVSGTYQLPFPDNHGDRPAAVRIIDILGEEVLVVEDRT